MTKERKRLTAAELKDLIDASVEKFNGLPPEEQRALREAQRENWVKGEMAMGEPLGKTRRVQAVGNAELDAGSTNHFDPDKRGFDPK